MLISNQSGSYFNAACTHSTLFSQTRLCNERCITITSEDIPERPNRDGMTIIDKMLALNLAVPWLWRLVNFPPRRPRFVPKSGHVGSVVDKVALGQVFSEYFSFPCQFSVHRLLHTHHLPSGADSIAQLVADVQSGPSLTPPQEGKKTISESKCVASTFDPTAASSLMSELRNVMH
jgi:hypothetical protein